jgi:ABC-2 type transport system ATP-binding protein
MIEVRDLSRYYGKTPALRDVSFDIADKQIVGVLGLNGAGKSTLLRILAGMLLPSMGSVKVDGVDAVDAPDSLRSRIGFLPETPPLYPAMRVREFLRWCGQVKGRRAADIDARLDGVLARCGIAHMADRVIDTLSHGYRKRVGIAQAIIHDPKLVILDEPVSGLDPAQIVEMRRVLRGLKESCTVLVSSHILSEISQTCDRILVIHDGRIVADGTEDELAHRLGARSRLALTLRGNRGVVESVFGSLDGIGTWAWGPDAGGTRRVDVELDRDIREELAGALVEAGVGLRRMVEVENELEQMFLGVTRADTELEAAS